MLAIHLLLFLREFNQIALGKCRSMWLVIHQSPGKSVKMLYKKDRKDRWIKCREIGGREVDRLVDRLERMQAMRPLENERLHFERYREEIYETTREKDRKRGGEREKSRERSHSIG